MKKLFFLLLYFFCSFYDAQSSDKDKKDKRWIMPAAIALGLGILGLKIHYWDRSPSFGNLFFTGALFATSRAFYLFPQNTVIGEILSSPLGISSPIVLGGYLFNQKVSKKDIGVAIENFGKALQ